MEDDKKKALKIAGIIVCVVLAALITYMNLPKRTGLGSIKEGELIWMKCKSKDCGAEYQIEKRDYFEFMQKNVSFAMVRPPMVCEKCNKKSAYRAVKCKKCDTMFFHGGSEGFMDRCTKCGFSETEELRKK